MIDDNKVDEKINNEFDRVLLKYCKLVIDKISKMGSVCKFAHVAEIIKLELFPHREEITSIEGDAIRAALVKLGIDGVTREWVSKTFEAYKLKATAEPAEPVKPVVPAAGSEPVAVEGPKKRKDDPRQLIRYDVRKHEEIVDDVEAQLVQDRTCLLFVRAGRLMQIRRMNELHQGVKYVRLGTEEVTEKIVHREIEKRFVFFHQKETKKDSGVYKWAEMGRAPMPVATTIVSARQNAWRFKPLNGIMQCPSIVVSTGGKMGPVGKPVSIMRPGFDDASGIYFDFKMEDFKRFMEHRIPYWGGAPGPTFNCMGAADAIAALADLMSLIEQTPYYDPEKPEDDGITPSHSVAISRKMTSVIRAGFAHAPVFASSSAEGGAGKSYNTGTSVLMSRGEPLSPISWPASADKQELSLDSALLSSLAEIQINNVPQNMKIGNEAYLNAVVTEASKLIRIYFTQGLKMCSTALTTIFINGVNLQIVGEIARRTLFEHIRQHKDGDEWDRSRDPHAMVRKDRGRYVFACHVLPHAYWWAKKVRRAWLAGDPTVGLDVLEYFGAGGQGAGVDWDARWAAVDALPQYNGFSGWCALVREALVWLGMPDPVHTMFRLKVNNPEAQRKNSVLEALYETFGDRPFTTASVLRYMRTHTEVVKEGGEGGDGPVVGVREVVRDFISEFPTAKYPGLINAVTQFCWFDDNKQSIHTYAQSLGARISTLARNNYEGGDYNIFRTGELEHSALFCVGKST